MSIARLMQQAAAGGGDDGTVSENRILYLNAADSNSYPGSGTTWSDLSPEGNDGILTNGPVYNSTYFEFDGDDDYVELGTISTSDPLQLSSPSGGGITIMLALWFNTGGDAFQRVIDKSDGGSSANGWSVYPNNANPNSGVLNFEFSGGTDLESGVVPTANTWSIWSFTWNSSTGAWEWKENNTTTATGTQTYSIPSVQTNMRIGTWNHSTGRELNGRIGFIMVYEKPLSSSELTQNYDALKATWGLT